MIDYIESLSKFADEIDYNSLPVQVIEQTKLYIADYYAASFAGFKINRIFNRAVIEVVRELSGKKQSTVMFEACKYSVQDAAFVNAVYAHGADMDDGNRKSAGHIGAHVISQFLH